MTYYIQNGNCIADGQGKSIPCDDSNRDYALIKVEVAAGRAVIVNWMPLDMPEKPIDFLFQAQLLEKLWKLRIKLSLEEARWFDYAILKKR